MKLILSIVLSLILYSSNVLAGETKLLISLGSVSVTIPGEWRHRVETQLNQEVITIIHHPDGAGTLKFKSLSAPKVVTREVLRNMTNVDSSIALDWQKWGDFSGYQYDYTESGVFYRQWWLVKQEEILLFVYSSDSQDDTERNVIDGIMTSLTAVK